MEKPKSDGKLPLTSFPAIAGVVAPHHIPMLLHEQHLRGRRVHRNAMNAMPDFRLRIGKLELRFQAAIRGQVPGKQNKMWRRRRLCLRPRCARRAAQ
jgi:hypothetical protein